MDGDLKEKLRWTPDDMTDNCYDCVVYQCYPILSGDENTPFFDRWLDYCLGDCGGTAPIRVEGGMVQRLEAEDRDRVTHIHTRMPTLRKDYIADLEAEANQELGRAQQNVEDGQKAADEAQGLLDLIGEELKGE